MNRRPKTKTTNVGAQLRVLAEQYDATSRAFEQGTGGHEQNPHKAVHYHGRAEGLRDAADKVDGAGVLAIGTMLAKPEGTIETRLTALENAVFGKPRAVDALDRVATKPVLTMENGYASNQRAQPPEPKPAPPAGAPALGAGEMRTLAALAQASRPYTTDDLAAITGFADRTVRNQLIALRSYGYAITTDEGHVVTGPVGVRAVYERLPTGEALVQEWIKKLPDGEALVLDLIAAADGDVVVASIDVGLAQRTVRNIIIALVGKCLVVRVGRGKVVLARVLRGGELQG